MGVSYLSISAVCTVFSFVGLQGLTAFSLEQLKSDGLIGDSAISTWNASHALDLLFSSHAKLALAANFVLNVFILLILSLKTLFFSELYSSEVQKLVERLINYVICKGAFLPLVVPPTVFQAGLWSIWLTVLCSLKMFQALARDWLERLNASPSAIVVHGFQFLDIWLHHSAGDSADFRISKLFDLSATGSLWEMKDILNRNLGFCLDMMTVFYGSSSLFAYLVASWHGFSSY